MHEKKVDIRDEDTFRQVAWTGPTRFYKKSTHILGEDGKSENKTVEANLGTLSSGAGYILHCAISPKWRLLQQSAEDPLSFITFGRKGDGQGTDME